MVFSTQTKALAEPPGVNLSPSYMGMEWGLGWEAEAGGWKVKACIL